MKIVIQYEGKKMKSLNEYIPVFRKSLVTGITSESYELKRGSIPSGCYILELCGSDIRREKLIIK